MEGGKEQWWQHLLVRWSPASYTAQRPSWSMGSDPHFCLVDQQLVGIAFYPPKGLNIIWLYSLPCNLESGHRFKLALKIQKETCCVSRKDLCVCVCWIKERQAGRQPMPSLSSCPWTLIVRMQCLELWQSSCNLEGKGRREKKKKREGESHKSHPRDPTLCHCTTQLWNCLME